MFLGHLSARFGIGGKPVQDHRLDDPLGIGKVLGTVFFECLEELGVETIGALERLGLFSGIQRTTWALGFWHTYIMYALPVEIQA